MLPKIPIDRFVLVRWYVDDVRVVKETATYYVDESPAIVLGAKMLRGGSGYDRFVDQWYVEHSDGPGGRWLGWAAPETALSVEAAPRYDTELEAVRVAANRLDTRVTMLARELRAVSAKAVVMRDYAIALEAARARKLDYSARRDGSRAEKRTT